MAPPRLRAEAAKQPPAASGFRDFYLLAELVRRDFSMRFTGSALGVTWAILQPLSLVILYWFVFTKIFDVSGLRAADFPGGSDGYVLFLICGLIPWLGFNEGLIRGTTSIVDNAALVRKLTFRSELLVVVPNVSAVLFELIGLGLFLIYLAVQGRPLWSLWMLPLAIAIQLGLQVGLSWLLATVHVFFRDVLQVLGFLLSIVFYLSPILYKVPRDYEKVFAWNPLAPLLGLIRSAILSAPLPSVGSIVLVLTVTVAAFGLGLVLFRRAQPSLSDLI